MNSDIERIMIDMNIDVKNVNLLQMEYTKKRIKSVIEKRITRVQE